MWSPSVSQVHYICLLTPNNQTKFISTSIARIVFLSDHNLHDECLDITLCGGVITMATPLGVTAFLTDFKDRAAEARVGPACSLETRGGRSQSSSCASEL